MKDPLEIITQTKDPIIQKNIDGTILKEWESASDIERSLGIARANILHSIKNNKDCSGYIWERKYNKQDIEKRLDVVGRVFGELTIIDNNVFLDPKLKAKVIKCKCSCGKEVLQRISYLINGRVGSCGHIRKKARLSEEDIVGKIFGNLAVIKIIEYKIIGNNRDYVVEALCSLCKRTIKARWRTLKSGRQISCSSCRSDKKYEV